MNGKPRVRLVEDERPLPLDLEPSNRPNVDCMDAFGQLPIVWPKDTKSSRYDYMMSLVASAKSGGCIRCREREPCCIDLHHVKPKSFNFNVRMKNLPSVEDWLAEIGKCIPLCSNCHRKEHKRLREVKRNAKALAEM